MTKTAADLYAEADALDALAVKTNGHADAYPLMKAADAKRAEASKVWNAAQPYHF